MIYNRPFYGFPRRYQQYPQYYYPPVQKPKNVISKNSISDDKRSKEHPKEKPNTSNDDNILEIFGIKLHFDDILLICLIFFLYNEGVQDQSLFIVLILLLLS